MKKNLLSRYLLLFLSLSFVVSCTNVLDKPVDPETFGQDSWALSHNKKYDSADFIFLSNYIHHWSGDSLKGLKTYREVLDSAYNQRALRVKMKVVLSVKVLQTTIERHHKNGNLSKILFWQKVVVKNNGQYPISEIGGYLYITNSRQDTLNVGGLYNQKKIYPNKPDTDLYSSALFYNHTTNAKQRELDTISADKLRFLWSPQKIVFTNGEKLIVKDSLNPDKYFKPDTP